MVLKQDSKGIDHLLVKFGLSSNKKKDKVLVEKREDI